VWNRHNFVTSKSNLRGPVPVALVYQWHNEIHSTKMYNELRNNCLLVLNQFVISSYIQPLVENSHIISTSFDFIYLFCMWIAFAVRSSQLVYTLYRFNCVWITQRVNSAWQRKVPWRNMRMSEEDQFTYQITGNISLPPNWRQLFRFSTVCI
jgi:hypothetical protein